MKINVKTPILSAVAFFGTLGILSVGYSAYTGLSSVTSGQPLTVSAWTQVKDNFTDIDARLSNFSFSGGSVGIGGSPSFKIDVPQTTGPIAGFGNLVVSSGWNTDTAFDGRTFTYLQSIYGRGTSGAWKMGYDSTTMRSAMIADGPIISTEDGASFAGKVGIGTSTPSEKLEINGNLKFTGNGSIISKAPRVVRSSDPGSGCPPVRAANTDLWTMPITLDRTSTVFLSGDSIKSLSIRADLQLYLDGNMLAQTISPPSTDWVGGHVQWSGTVAAGSHTVSVRSPQASAWGCGSTWGNMEALIFEN